MATPPKRGPEDDNWGKLASDLFGINFGVDDELDLPDPDAPDFAPAEPVDDEVVEVAAVPIDRAPQVIVAAANETPNDLDDLFAGFEDEPQPVTIKPPSRGHKPKPEPAKPAAAAETSDVVSDIPEFDTAEEPSDTDGLTVAEQHDDFWNPLAEWNWDETKSTETGSRGDGAPRTADRPRRDGDSRGGRGRSGGRSDDRPRSPRPTDENRSSGDFRPEPAVVDDVADERPRRPVREPARAGEGADQSRRPRRDGAAPPREAPPAHREGGETRDGTSDDRSRRRERGEARPRAEAAPRTEASRPSEGTRPPRRDDRRDRPPRREPANRDQAHREPVNEVRRHVDAPSSDMLDDEFATGLDHGGHSDAPRSRPARNDRPQDTRRPVAKKTLDDDFFDEELLDGAQAGNELEDDDFEEGMASKQEPQSAEDRPRRRRRRRRSGGPSPRYADQGRDAGEEGFQEVGQPGDPLDDEEALDATDGPDEELDGDEGRDQPSAPPSRRPQRGRRRGRTNDSRFEVVEHSMLPDVEPRQVPEYDDEDDDDPDGEQEVPRVSYEEIPSWEEAISLLARVTGPDRHRGRGDGRRNDGRRGDGRPGDGRPSDGRRGDGNRDYR